MRKMCSVILALTMVICLFVGNQAHAEEKKSVGLAVLMGLDPLPADALFYSGQNVQGVLNLGLAAGGIGLMIHGVSQDSWDGFGQALLGLSLYGGSLVWDLIGGAFGVHQHNKKVQARQTKHGFFQRVQPNLMIVPNGVQGGVRVSF